MNKATLRLFNAIQVDNRHNKKLSDAIYARTVKHGYVVDPAINPDNKLLDFIEEVIGISAEKANTAFHKSWAVVQDSPMEALFMQQVVHYFTTYGFENAGIYSEASVYIPQEVLEIPEIRENVPIVVIRALNAGEILEQIIKLGSGVALAAETLDDMMAIIKANAYDTALVEKVTNRELKARLYDFYQLVPREPVEFLRHLVSKLTDESLLIKNDALIEKIKQSNGKFLDMLLKDAPEDLASIFFRFKPLFLAMKHISRNKTYFNQLRKKANQIHTPMPEDFLNSVTARIKRSALDPDKLAKRLENASIYRKIRLAYALKHRLHAGRSIVYRVRNGRGWATGFDWPAHLIIPTEAALSTVLDSIVSDIKPNVEGKTIYIPGNVHYTLPATEKQFTGNLPTGSSISVPQDLIVGVHWTNTKNKRVDLDLSVVGETGKIGWDASYRSKGNNVLFSGDITDAPPPKGATELFYLREGQDEARILFLNYFNFEKSDEIEAKILVSHERPKKFKSNYMVDPNNILATANINVNKKQNILGLIANVKGENRVYFANVSIGNSITSHRNEQGSMVRKYFINNMVNSLDLGEIFSMAGANVVDCIVADVAAGLVDSPTGPDFIDLSPQQLNKSTLLDLIKPGTDK